MTETTIPSRPGAAAPTAPGQALIEGAGGLVLVNLPHRRDRRAEFGEQLHRLGLDYGQPGIRVFDAVRPEDKGPFSSIGARGCFLSHLGILREALARGDERVLICEDDLNFAPDLAARAGYLRDQLQSLGWDIFYGGYGTAPTGPTVDPEGWLVSVPPEAEIRCAHMLAFRRPAIEALVPYLEAMLARPPGDPAGGPMHVDGAYNWFRRAHPQMVTLAAVPEAGYQRASLTDIHPHGWHDRLPVMRQLTRIARRLRNRVAG